MQKTGMANVSETSLVEIGTRIRLLRLALGHSNASQFAALTGFTPQQLNNYERGKKRPELSMAIRICQRTGATLDWIYRGERAGMPFDLMRSIDDQSPDRSVQTRA